MSNDEILKFDPAESSERFEKYQAKEAGLSVDEWRALPESERTRIEEDITDTKSANQCNETLEQRRKRERRLFEAGKWKPEYGAPQWLRDQYAAEDPIKVVLEFLEILTEISLSSGPRLAQAWRKLDHRTWRGWLIHDEPPYPDARELVLDELKRVNLLELFLEAEAQERQRAN